MNPSLKVSLLDVEEEESMRSVVLQPLCEIFSPPVLQLTANPRAEHFT